MDSSTFISAFTINGNILYAKIKWEDNETDLFQILIYDKQHWWAGRFSQVFAEEFREHADEDENEYKKNVKASLMNTQDMCKYEFSSTSGDTGAAKFCWKKTYKDSTVTLHGSIPVHKINVPEDGNPFIDFLLNENQKLEELNKAYELNIHKLSEELEQSNSELEKFMNIKSDLEMSVYGKFITLLNSKKRRIQLLEQNLIDTNVSEQNELD